MKWIFRFSSTVERLLFLLLAPAVSWSSWLRDAVDPVCDLCHPNPMARKAAIGPRVRDGKWVEPRSSQKSWPRTAQDVASSVDTSQWWRYDLTDLG